MQETDAQRSYFRWIMLAGLCLLYVCFAMVHFSTSALADSMITDLGLSLTEMGSIMGAWPLAYIVIALPVGILLDRFGVRYMLLFGIVVIVLSAYLRVHAQGHRDMFIAVLIFGVGAPFISVGSSKLIREWVAQNERGIALSICMSMTALGALLGLNLTHEVLSIYDGSWRKTLQLYAMISTFIALIWLIIIHHSLCKYQTSGKSTETLSEITRGCLRLLRIPSMQVLLVLSMGTFFYIHTTINWLPKLLAETNPNLSEGASAQWASVPVLIGIIGAIFAPRFAKRNREAMVLVFLFSFAGLSSILLVSTLQIEIVLLSMVLIGIVRGGLRPVSSLLLMHMPAISQNNIGAATGLFFAIGQIGGVSGPVVFGYLADIGDGFELPLYFLTGVCLFLSLVCLLLAKMSRLDKG